MTLSARRREELERERAPEASEARRSVAVRPPQPRPSFLHLQSAIGNRALSGLLEKGPKGQQGQQGQEEEWLRRMLLVSAVPGAPAVPALLLPRRFLVPDGAAPAPGQMTRDGFLAAMRDAAREAAERGLAEVGRTAQGCPWIEHYFRFYQRQSAGRVEADLRRYVPTARGAASAEELLALAAGHVGESVRHWAATGELTGVPRGLPGAGLVGALAGPLAAVQARLGEGRPLESATRSRMEQAFGARFDEVRVHTGETAARLARELDARAFAVGPHVAFGHGEYRPGTLVGDAVLAHELAHTLQQRGATAEAGPAAPARSLEGEANTAAAGVLARLWGGAGALAGRFAGLTMPRLRSGLVLARCQENFSDQELRTYLQHVTSGPEGGLLGDNKARAVVRENLAHPGKFPLSDAQVRNMIEEMLQGSTGEDDQKAILELVKDSKAARLQFLFTKGGLTSKRLLGKIKDERATELKAFLDQRFEGDLKALEAGKVRAVPEEDLEEIPTDYENKDKSRGFRTEDLQNLRQQGQSLTFNGSLAPLGDDVQRLLLDNIAATVSFVLDPQNPDRIAEVKALQQDLQAEGPKGDFFNSRMADTPAERLDATDFYHGHVCVPDAVLENSALLKELRDKASSFHDFPGPNPKLSKAVRTAIGDGGMTRTRPQARRVVAAVESHRARFLKALGPLLDALRTVPEAAVSYHTWENARPSFGGKRLDPEHPIRHILTPFATQRPTFERVGDRDCVTVIDFAFHVNRRGQITLLPGAPGRGTEMVRAYEILYGWEEGPEPAPGGKP
ncbi:MAG: DUF4157 domain-containing protein [Thermoanaerobaculia bacterium]